MGRLGQRMNQDRQSAPYEIKNGRIVIRRYRELRSNVMVYKVGDKYIAARSNEFGYASYEVQVTD